MPYKQPFYYPEVPDETQQVQALIEQFGQSIQQGQGRGQGVVVQPPQYAQYAVPPPPPPRPNAPDATSTASSASGAVYGPGWGAAPTEIQLADKQLHEQNRRDQAIEQWRSEGWKDPEIQAWLAMSPEQQRQAHHHDLAKARLNEATRWSAQEINFKDISHES